VMDHGKLTDHNGKSVDFRNVVLIMTTNAGATDLAKPPIGFSQSKREGDDEEAINRMFSPEFRNRLDAVVGFANLPREIVRRVVEKFIFELEVQLADRNITIALSDEATDWIVGQGYDEKFGARPLARVIQEYIKKPLADEVLFGKLMKGGAVSVTLVVEKNGTKILDFKFEEPNRPAPKPTTKSPSKQNKGRKSSVRARGAPKKDGGSGGKGSVPKVSLTVD
jgi:ATP-dependent Clp protease ATP-binding subunit ClpA